MAYRGSLVRSAGLLEGLDLVAACLMLVDTTVHNHVRINFQTIMHPCKLIRTADQLALHDLLAGLPSFGCLLLDMPSQSSNSCQK